MTMDSVKVEGFTPSTSFVLFGYTAEVFAILATFEGG
jgi:hypothetical protein